MDDMEYRIVNMTIYRCCEKVGDNLRHYLWEYITPKRPPLKLIDSLPMGKVQYSIENEIRKYKF
jgi:hypothetical protein